MTHITVYWSSAVQAAQAGNECVPTTQDPTQLEPSKEEHQSCGTVNNVKDQ